MDWICQHFVIIGLVWAALIVLFVLFLIGASSRRYRDRDWMPGPEDIE